MAQFRTRDIVEIDAAIIAGLMILLTVQSVTGTSIMTTANQLDEQLSTKNIEKTSYVTTIQRLQSDLSQTTDPDTKKQIQSEITDLQMKEYQIQVEIDGLTAKDNQWLKSTIGSGLISKIVLFKTGIIVTFSSFIISIITEGLASVLSRFNKSEKATRLGISFMIIGCLSLAVSLYVIFSTGFLA